MIKTRYLYVVTAIAFVALAAVAVRKVVMGGSLDLLGLGFAIGVCGAILAYPRGAGKADSN
jgi:hypothetical protein